ncbi:protein mono-ADP-ribosyltransferase PARP12 [Triplophysa rosa]|uniref:Poly [ADP-ribose] polymerase 12-like n=1 Tax=Triplophysa rosa TaxID=992332 RepID=A0A9W7WB05_TRIRA|nr:protein mono-ADP-ribosyltransferase PARP12 [Triplophysa rosa]KAI7792199.1 hypothetical protein IRJ41_022135 [Triplophysa rosa]
MNMASNHQEDSENLYENASEFSDSNSETASDSGSCHSSDSNSSDRTAKRNICRYYNDGHCRYGDKCQNEHICKYYVNDSCRYGAGCRLNHNPRSHASRGPNERRERKSYGGRHRRKSSPSSEDSDEDDGRPYRWQLDLGDGWEDIANDHILEAQFSRPNTKGIRIYNTRAGAISIDFTKMRVLKKRNIKVRRKGSKQTEWLWYYRGDHGWYQYGEKGSKGKASLIQSSKLEKEYQKNLQGSVQFPIDSHTYEISFKGMYQKNVSTDLKRRVRRRPKYEPSQTGVLTSVFKKLMAPVNKTPVWQFEGRKGKWHTFKNTGGCSVSSDDIEKCYQKQQNTMTFTINDDNYTLNFSRMNQVNNRTNAKRKIQRT